MSLPTLSVVVSNYNHGHFLGNSLSAIIGQSCPPDEIIVFDDASTDHSRSVIEKIAAQNTIIRTVFNEKNVGPMVNFTRGLRMARGEYFFTAAADDCVLPGFFEKSMIRAEKNPSVGLVCSDPVFFNDGEERMWAMPLPLNRRAAHLSPPDVVKAVRAKPFYIPGHATINNRAAALQAGAYIPELKWHADWFMNLVVAFRHGIDYLPEALSAMRLIPGSYSSLAKRTPSDQKRVLEALVALLNSAPYADVRDAFIQSCVLVHFGKEILELACENGAASSLLDRLTYRRLRTARCRGMISRMVPTTLKDFTKKILWPQSASVEVVRR